MFLSQIEMRQGTLFSFERTTGIAKSQITAFTLCLSMILISFVFNSQLIFIEDLSPTRPCAYITYIILFNPLNSLNKEGSSFCQ
jgi:hypothetical protein